MNRLYGIILLTLAIGTIFLSRSAGDDITGSVALLMLSVATMKGGSYEP